MSELTKEHFDKEISRLLDTVAAKSEVHDRFATIEQILESHTVSLDAIAKNVVNWNTEIAAVRSALKRHEQLFHAIADNLGMDLDDLLRGSR